MFLGQPSDKRVSEEYYAGTELHTAATHTPYTRHTHCTARTHTHTHTHRTARTHTHTHSVAVIVV